MTRFIHYSDINNNEWIFITDDLEADANDFVPSKCSLVSDTSYAIDLPYNFPTENSFKKEL